MKLLKYSLNVNVHICITWTCDGAKFVVSYQTSQQNNAVWPGLEGKHDRQAPKLQVLNTTSLFQTFSIAKLILNTEWTHQLPNWRSLPTELNLTGLLKVEKQADRTFTLQAMPAIYLQRNTFFDRSSLKKCTRYYNPWSIQSEDKQPKRQRHWQHPAEVVGFVLALHSGRGLNPQQEKTVGSYPHL